MYEVTTFMYKRVYLLLNQKYFFALQPILVSQSNMHSDVCVLIVNFVGSSYDPLCLIIWPTFLRFTTYWTFLRNSASLHSHKTSSCSDTDFSSTINCWTHIYRQVCRYVYSCCCSSSYSLYCWLMSFKLL